ncbi:MULTISPECIES: DUF5986 family protein [unclassified Paenibacillus]|uniref:DUF5986 family protein n=1 Tax=unclassified Paenibacillus TaxID=185978 RepID=UPI00020D708F|nr:MULTISPECIES: DUF5986 family protein [unclassified Paenibacillus]EGL18161.1 hypothetical protein HMPREF9413_5987 [Paenibacillus sp. HGF7]EPD88103.1 hypothetical protein HMPREF1207_02645 [Paenibacillus sp. HGH0039]
MVKQDLYISMADNHKTVIIDAIRNASKKDIMEFRMERKVETFNSVHFLKWDFINTNLIRTLPTSQFQCVKIKRGPLWELVLIYDKETQYLYAAMQEKRFHQLSERTYKETVHYIDALSSINCDLEANVKLNPAKQLSLFESENDDWNAQVEYELNSMLHMLEGEVKRFVLITFSTEKGEIASVNAIMPNAKLEITYEENWNEFITADFSIALESQGAIAAEQEEEIFVGLREGVISHQQNDDLVQLRDDETEKEG